jgi:integrase
MVCLLMNPSTFRDKFSETLSKIDGVRNLTPHCCRHTYVSQLQAEGIDIEVIKNLTGHAEIDMTEHYMHIQEKAKNSAAEAISPLFSTE